MFDCVAPTRIARHGMAYTDTGRLNLRNASNIHDLEPLEKNCQCHTCTRYTRSYLHHLFVAGEMTAMRLLSIHNIHFLLNLMREARTAIFNDRYQEFLKKHSS
jgi:queuine tRNA-ribosyltransferase